MSEGYKVIYSPQALDDLKDVYAYIAHELQEPGIAYAQIERIRNEVRSLDFMPLRYSLVDWEPWKSKGVHKVPVNNFMLFYTADTETMLVTILRIIYGGRDIEHLAKEDRSDCTAEG